MTAEAQTEQMQVDAEILGLLPRQGEWTDESYLWLTDFTNHYIELVDGVLEVLPMPTDQHQTILMYLYELFAAFLRPLGGKVLVAPLRLRIREGNYREPDLLVLCDAADARRQNRFWLGADLVLEVVSPDKPERDRVTKRAEYALANVSEYWIVDPESQTITVLELADEAYVERGVFERGTNAVSTVLDGFSVDVASVFAAD